MEITFAELGLNEQILAGVATLGFNEPTPVQAAAIPAVLAGKDVVASAQTGTGKTAAFMLPTLQRIAVEKHDKAEKPDGKRSTGKRNAYPRALIITPTRELAAQIDNVAKSVCASTGQHASLSPVALATNTR